LAALQKFCADPVRTGCTCRFQLLYLVSYFFDSDESVHQSGPDRNLFGPGDISTVFACEYVTEASVELFRNLVNKVFMAEMKIYCSFFLRVAEGSRQREHKTMFQLEV
jgi:hypothetical protein